MYTTTNNTEADAVLKGVVRVENLNTPEQYIEDVLKRVKVEYLTQTYGVSDWNNDPHSFLEKYALKTGKLLRGGEADTYSTAKMVLRDWQRGRLPYFVCPPFEDDIERERLRKENEGKDLPRVEQMFSKIAVRARFDHHRRKSAGRTGGGHGSGGAGGADHGGCGRGEQECRDRGRGSRGGREGARDQARKHQSEVKGEGKKRKRAAREEEEEEERDDIPDVERQRRGRR